jgi:hypothetical protein
VEDMNHILFRIAELEEKFQRNLEACGPIDRLVNEAQLKTLNIFKYHPISSQEEANQLMHKMNIVFGL